MAFWFAKNGSSHCQAQFKAERGVAEMGTSVSKVVRSRESTVCDLRALVMFRMAGPRRWHSILSMTQRHRNTPRTYSKPTHAFYSEAFAESIQLSVVVECAACLPTLWLYWLVYSCLCDEEKLLFTLKRVPFFGKETPCFNLIFWNTNTNKKNTIEEQESAVTSNLVNISVSISCDPR